MHWLLYGLFLIIIKIMDKFHKELFYVLMRCRNIDKRESKAAAMQQPEIITICRKEYKDLKDQKCANVIKQVIRKSMPSLLGLIGNTFHTQDIDRARELGKITRQLTSTHRNQWA
jgi:uncharacterized protein YpiB (UPF0302 family)